MDMAYMLYGNSSRELMKKNGRYDWVATATLIERQMVDELHEAYTSGDIDLYSYTLYCAFVYIRAAKEVALAKRLVRQRTANRQREQAQEDGS